MTGPAAALALALLLFLPHPAGAGGWSASDLGDSDTDAACIARATGMFTLFGERYRIEEVQASDWIVIGNGLTHVDFDAAVTCSFGPGGRTRATLVVHSAGGASAELRTRITEALKRIWTGN